MSLGRAPDGSPYLPALNGTIIPSSHCTADICSLTYAQIDYVPSLSANLAYLVIFVIILFVQIGVCIRHRTWKFMVGIVCGILLEIVGYGGRIGLHFDPFSFNMFLVYLICLTIGPAFLSAAIYLCLSRLIEVHGTAPARFRPRTYTIIFICCDLFSLILQAAGGAIAATANTKPSEQTGVNVMVAGLAFQVFSLVLFMCLCLDYVVRLKKVGGSKMNAGVSQFAGMRKTAFKFLPFVLAISTILIFIRCVYRVAELSGGFKSSLANNQTLFLIFEGPMIILAVLALTLCHPAFALPPSATTTTASEVQGYESMDTSLNGEVEMINARADK